LKLSDFQGRYTDLAGTTVNRLALENAKSFLPRAGDHSNYNSDLFALGMAMYEIITGHEPFPDLDHLDDEIEIERRYTLGDFPTIEDVLGGKIILNCWKLQYDTADTCFKDLVSLEEYASDRCEHD